MNQQAADSAPIMDLITHNSGEIKKATIARLSANIKKPI
jgi:hypothetical protein